MSKIVQEDQRLTNSLRTTTQQYVRIKKERAQTAKKLYDSFLKDYVFSFERNKDKIAENLKKHFKKDKVRVVAVDGTKYIRGRRGVIIFYVMSAPLLYEIDLTSNPPKWYRVEEETTRHNVMILMPIPLSEIYLVDQRGSSSGLEEGEEESDEDTVSISEILPHPRKIGQIDMALMRLAEVYSVYWSMENQKPDVILVDGSLFEMYSYTNRQPEQIALHKGEVLGVRTYENDYRILKSIPTSSELEIPSVTSTREFLTAELLKFGEVELKKAGSTYAFASKLAGRQVNVTFRQIKRWKDFGYFDETVAGDLMKVKIKPEFADSLDRLSGLFKKVCQEGFDKNNLGAFKVYITQGGTKLYLYMNEADIETIARIGLNTIIQNCWDKDTLLMSVTKDSYVRFFIDNFLMLGSPRHLNVFKVNPDLLPNVPSTDPGVLYDITHDNEELHAPLALMEFDPAISTLFSQYDDAAKKYVIGRGIMIAQERQFLRALVEAAEDSMGRKSYVYTIDRITYPKWDKGFDVLNVDVDKIPHRFAYYSKPSELLNVMVGLLCILSSNRHDAVFGYPDPLFEVDQYVKTIGLTHLESLDVSLEEIDLDEFSVTYRQTREGVGEHHGRSLLE